MTATHARRTMVAVVLSVMAAGCSSDAPSIDSSAPTTTSTTPTSTSDTTTTSTTTTVPTTTTTVAPTSTTSDPFEVPDPPVEPCPIVAYDRPVATLTITDNGVTYLGASAPPCLRVAELQALELANLAEGDATVSVGGLDFAVFTGDTTTTGLMGTYAAVGDTLDVYVVELDTAIVIQVLPSE